MKKQLISIAAYIIIFIFFGNNDILKWLIQKSILSEVPIINVGFSSLLGLTIFGVFVFIISTYAKFEEHKINVGLINKFNKYVNFFVYLSNWSITFFVYLILLLLGSEIQCNTTDYQRFLSCIFYLDCINYVFLVLLIIYIWVLAPLKDNIKVKGLIKSSGYYQKIEKFIEI